MYSRLVILLLAALACTISATPHPPIITPAPGLAKLAAREKPCSFSGWRGPSQLAESKASCATMTLDSFVVPSAKSLDLGELSDNTHIFLKGRTRFEYKEWKGPLVRVSGRGITIDGRGSYFDAEGERWWNTMGIDNTTKPDFAHLHNLTDATIQFLTFQRTPGLGISIQNAYNTDIENVTLSSNIPEKRRFKDGVKVSDSSRLTLNGIRVRNQDHCVTVCSGSDIAFIEGHCLHGYGLGVGSVGDCPQDNLSIKRVKFIRNRVMSSFQGIHVKAVANTSGTISDIVFDDVYMTQIQKTGILIDQMSGSENMTETPTKNVRIDGLEIKNIQAYQQMNSLSYSSIIKCGKNQCTNWKAEGIDMSGGRMYENCTGVPDGLQKSGLCLNKS